MTKGVNKVVGYLDALSLENQQRVLRLGLDVIRQRKRAKHNIIVSDKHYSLRVTLKLNRSVVKRGRQRQPCVCVCVCVCVYGCGVDV
jgi:hypothetical protein